MLKNFVIPVFVFISLLLYSLLHLYLHQDGLARIIILLAVVAGSWQLVRDTVQSILKKNFALDYIAILAIIVGVVTQNYFVAGVIVLMMSGGNALEEYAQERAKKSLTALKNRIPNNAQVRDEHGSVRSVKIETIAVGATIVVRKGEVVPLDGVLLSEHGLFDESSLTGEAIPSEKQKNELVRSGTINTGEVATIQTTVISSDSTYHRIIALVKEAEDATTPFIGLADTLSLWFTVATLVLAGMAYLFSGSLERVLAVLVIATPCPLILATPIALIGGMNAAARARIIFKKLASLEVLSRVDTIIFDKTGTITMGVPQLHLIESFDTRYTQDEILALASGLEKNSLHPYARAIVATAQKKDITPTVYAAVSEHIGLGIEGKFGKNVYLLSSDIEHPDSRVLLTENKKRIGAFTFRDELKKESSEIVQNLLSMGLKVAVFTGDTKARAQELLKKLPSGIDLQSQLLPGEKKEKLDTLKHGGHIVAMVGDGINDAPALASADVGIAFSNQEHTAASESADVVLLGKSFSGVLEAVKISRHTLYIARQSMYVGVGLSVLGMLFAVGGYIPPIIGALCQEIIDIAVIFNALRTAFQKT